MFIEVNGELPALPTLPSPMLSSPGPRDCQLQSCKRDTTDKSGWGCSLVYEMAILQNTHQEHTEEVTP